MSTDEVVSTPFGKFLVNDRDLIESTIKAGTVWDGPGFLQVIAKEHGRLGEAGVTILDVGANVGAWTIDLCSRGAWRVVAVEPIPQTRSRLLANLDLNKSICADSVIVLECAAYDAVVDLCLVNELNRGNMGETAVQPVTADPTGTAAICQGARLDWYKHLYGDVVSLIKLDVQGCEAKAIFGLEQVITRDHPVIVFEWEADLAARHLVRLDQLEYWLNTKGYVVKPWPNRAHDFIAIPR